ncbi:MAG: FAD-binding protein [Clostridia bacterium]|nr:FAD-binding protein [Clostridia bacterium]
MYDIAIIGGGPAGSTLARLIGKKYKVLLLEKRSFSTESPFPSQKCCGGLIDPDAQKMLAKFGLGIPKSVLLSPQLFAVRTIDMDNAIEKYFQRHYINVDREEFDKWLVSIIPPGVDRVERAVFKTFYEENGGIRLKYHVDGREYTEKARLIVGADGALSKVRKQAFKDLPSPKLYISIQEWFELKENLNFYGAIFDSEVTDFYSWTIPKENYLILGTAVKPGKDAYKKFSLLKDKLTQYGYNLEPYVKRNGAYLRRPVKNSQVLIGNDKIALVGEAGGFISPSSAEGLSYAFRSALALAKALEKGIEGFNPQYAKNVTSLMRDIRIKNLKSPAMYNPHLRKFILKTGIMTIDLEKLYLD